MQGTFRVPGTMRPNKAEEEEVSPSWWHEWGERRHVGNVKPYCVFHWEPGVANTQMSGDTQRELQEGPQARPRPQWGYLGGGGDAGGGAVGVK